MLQEEDVIQMRYQHHQSYEDLILYTWLWQAEIEKKEIIWSAGLVEMKDETIEMNVVWLELPESKVLVVINIQVEINLKKLYFQWTSWIVYWNKAILNKEWDDDDLI